MSVAVPIWPLTPSYGTYTESIHQLRYRYGQLQYRYVNYGSSGEKGLPGLCSVLPLAYNVDVLCCTATRTALSVMSHTLYNHQSKICSQCSSFMKHGVT